MSRLNLARIGLLVSLLLAIGVAFAYRQRVDLALLQDWLDAAGAAAPLAFVVLYVIATVLFLPGSVLTLAGGALFGPVAGTAYSLLGATLGATAAFLLARYVARDWTARRAGGRLRQLLDGVDAEGWRFVAFVRLVPLFPFNLLNYALGLTRISAAQYVAASFVCMFPGALAYTYLGYAGRSAASAADNAIQAVLVALALLATVLFLPALMRRWRRPAGIAAKLTAADLNERRSRQDDMTILDVRSAAEYNGDLGHIRGALNIPLDQLRERLAEIESHRDRLLAVVCRTSRRSHEAQRILQDAGFRNAVVVVDGMIGWKRRQLPTEP